MTITTETLDRFQMLGQDIGELLARQADRRADHPALVWSPSSGEERRWTYAELWADVQSLAAGLAARGIGVGDRVLVHSENCPEMVISSLACSTVGATSVTTNTKSVEAEVTYFAEHTRAVAAITQPQFAALVAAAAPELQWIAVTADNSGEAPPPDQLDHDFVAFDELATAAEDWAGRPADPMLPSSIMFTSGTTSRPKAVVHTHANAIWASRSGPRSIDLGPDDTYLIYLPFFHVNALNWSLFAVLGVGATAVMMPKWSQSRFWPVVTDHRVTHLSVMPFVMGALASPDRPTDHALRVGVFGFVSPQMDQMLGISVYGAFGMTETVTHCVSAKPYEHLADRAMGRAVPGYEVAVVDQDSGELCDDGQPGELWVRGTRGIQLFLEYDSNPEANDKAFSEDWFKTGDIVRATSAGELIYLERDKDLLKVGGENVSAREVEDVAGAHDAVRQAAVVGAPDDFLSEVPVAFVILNPGDHDHDAVAAEIIASCEQRLASFKVPRRVHVVEAFPTGTLDKILKNRLRDLAAELATT